MSYTAKSIVFDFTDCWNAMYEIIGIRTIEFLLNGSNVITIADCTAYQSGSADPPTTDAINAFDPDTPKTGTGEDGCWGVVATTNQRIILVGDDSITFDSIVVNNIHFSGEQTGAGVKNTKITITSSEYTSTTYGATVTGGSLIFDGVIAEHSAVDEEDDQILTLLDPLIISDTEYKNEIVYQDPVKSVVFTTTSGLGGSGGNGFRSIEFIKDGSVIPMNGNYSVYANSTFNLGYTGYELTNAFNTTLSKTGAALNNAYRAQYSSVICVTIVFDSTQEFDAIVINNYHDSGTMTTNGFVGVKIYTSTDSITVPVYAEAADYLLIADLDLEEHTAIDEIANQHYSLLTPCEVDFTYSNKIIPTLIYSDLNVAIGSSLFSSTAPKADLILVNSLLVQSDVTVYAVIQEDFSKWDFVTFYDLSSKMYTDFEINIWLTGNIENDFTVCNGIFLSTDFFVTGSVYIHSDLELRNILSVVLVDDFEATNDLSLLNLCTSDTWITYTLQALLDAHIETPTIVAKVDGVLVNLTDTLTISLDEDSYCYSLSMEVLNITSYFQCAPGKIITITINDIPYIFKIDSRKRSRQFGAEVFSIDGRTPTSILGTTTVTKTWSRILASQVIHELCTAYDVSYEYTLIDWIIPEGVLSAESETPISVIQRVAAACGGLVQPSRAGELLIMKKYETVPTNMELSSVVSLSDEHDIFSVEESFETFDKWNTVTVTNIDSETSSEYSLTEVDSDSTDYNNKKLELVIYPFVESATLETSYESTLFSISDGGSNPVQVEKEETISILSGTGSVGYPVKNVLQTRYITANIGDVTHAGKNIYTSSKKESLLYIKYVTEVHEFFAYLNPSAEDKQVQIFLKET